VHLEERYMIGGVKTSAGINRIIPIAKKILPFVQNLYDSGTPYLLAHDSKRYSRADFMKTFWEPAMNLLGMKHLPHDTRYTCATMMDRANVNENSKKTILGHSKEGVTNKIYVEKDLLDLLTAIDMI
ncbi:MAG: recombinase XerD, partial [Lachnospiraceae bacterium]|nr:recombinase XerD [Lachnospiraceae bacterium]